MSSPPVQLTRRALALLLPWALLPRSLRAQFSDSDNSIIAVLPEAISSAPNALRIYLISKSNLVFDHMLLLNPPRLVIDIRNIDETLNALLPTISEQEFPINSIRLAKYKPGVVRFVVELKQEAAIALYRAPTEKSINSRLALEFYPDSKLPTAKHPDEVRLRFADAGTSTRFNDSQQGGETSGNRISSSSGSSSSNGSSRDPEDSVATTPKRYGRGDRVILVLDPGHGGIDPGAIGAAGTQEKVVTLEIAKRLAEQLEREHPVKVVLTRSRDFFVPLGDRVEKARQARAELFISLHADAWIKPDARGSSIFVLSEKAASSSAARWLAKIQNEVDILGGVNIATRDKMLASTLLDLSQAATKVDSLRFAKITLQEVGRFNRLHRGDVEYANFAVLKAPDIPSILFETAFISNPEEEQLLRDDNYQIKLTSALSASIGKYFAKSPSKKKVDDSSES